MEALQNTPFGWKAWSKENSPISVSTDSFDSSQHERDAMLQVIGFLITENKSLKLENQKLKEARLNHDSKVKLKEADTQLKLKKSQQVPHHGIQKGTVRFSKSLKKLNFHSNGQSREINIGRVCTRCNLRHVNTKHCPALGKKCHR